MVPRPSPFVQILLPSTAMNRGMLALAVLAIAAFVGALVALQRAPAPVPSSPEPAPTAQRPAPPADAPPASADPPTPAASRTVGLQLGKGSSPTARADAQSIIDTSLAELRRLDSRHADTARDVYMKAHSAVERVEDELPDDDEPGRAKLRADSEALRAELQRIYGADE